MTQPDRLRYLPGRSRNKAHLIPYWQDGHAVHSARCGISVFNGFWYGGSLQEARIAASRPLCRNCLAVYEINEGKPYRKAVTA